MTYDQYWNDDPMLVKYYRKAAEISMDRKNQELWLQGMYIYDALCAVSPVLHAFVQKGTKPVPYPKQPYPISQRQQEQNKISEEKRIMNKGKAFMLALMAQQKAQKAQAEAAKPEPDGQDDPVERRCSDGGNN